MKLREGAGRGVPRPAGEKNRRLPSWELRSERLTSSYARTKTGHSLVLRAASGGRNRRQLVGHARVLHWAPVEHENRLLCDLPRCAVLADYAATCFLSNSCRCRAIQWMVLGRELDRSEIRARASETSSNDTLLCCWSSSRRGLLETTTKAASSCCLSAILASCASQYSQGISWLTFSLSVPEFCALYRSGSGSIGMASG